MIWVTIGIVVVLAGVLSLAPNLSRDTVPLGVSVPRDRATDPVVRRAIVRYRLEVLVAAALVVAGAAGLGGSTSGEALAAALAPVVLLVLGFAALVVSRRPIIAAKQEQEWYAGHQVRLLGQVGRGSVAETRVPFAWYAGAATVVLVTAVVGFVRYDDQPDPYPTHWTLSGHADAFAARSPWTVFGVVFVMTGLVVGIALIAVLVRLSGVRKYPDGDPVHADLVMRARLRAVQLSLGLLTVLLTLGLAVVQIGVWSAAGTSVSPMLMVTLLLLTLAGVVGTVVLFLRAGRSEAGGGTQRGPDTPDDDRHWRGGVFYVNRDDPSWLVPKRVGVGWTLNFARPVSILVVVLIVVVVVVAALAALGGTH